MTPVNQQTSQPMGMASTPTGGGFTFGQTPVAPPAPTIPLPSGASVSLGGLLGGTATSPPAESGGFTFGTAPLAGLFTPNFFGARRGSGIGGGITRDTDMARNFQVF